MFTLSALPSARLRVLPLLLAPFFPGLVGAAAAPPPPADDTFFESVDVAVANIEVFVTDRSGKPVSGLTKDDFEVFENGKRVEVTHFFAQDVAAEAPALPASSAASAGSAASAASPGSASVEAPLERTFAVFLDDANLTTSGRNRALQGIEKVVVGLAPRDRFVLIQYGGSLRLQSFPAADREGILKALRRKMAPGGGETAAAKDELNSRLATADADDPTQQEIVLDDMELFAQSRQNQVEATYAALGRSVDALAGLPGHKAVLVVTGDLPIRPGEEFFGVSVQGTLRNDTRAKLSRIIARANAGRVTLYGLGVPQGNRMGDQQAPLSVTASLMDMAGGTGGQFVIDPSDPTQLAAKVVDDLTTFYSLGYAPPAGKAEAARQIKVRLKKPGLSVRYREAYQVKSGVERARDRTTAALMLGEASNPLGLSVEFGEARLDDKGNYVVEVTVKFPLDRMALLPAGAMRKGRLVLFLGSRATGGKVSELTTIKLPLNIPEEKLAEALKQQGGYSTRLLLRAEPCQVVVGLRDDLGNSDSTLLVPWSPPVGEKSKG